MTIEAAEIWKNAWEPPATLLKQKAKSMTFEEFKIEFDATIGKMSQDELSRAGVKLTPDQQRWDQQQAPRCVCCERPFSEQLPKAGELSFMGQHGDGCKDCIDAMKENE